MCHDTLERLYHGHNLGASHLMEVKRERNVKYESAAALSTPSSLGASACDAVGHHAALKRLRIITFNGRAQLCVLRVAINGLSQHFL